jgi:hypothetical protein
MHMSGRVENEYDRVLSRKASSVLDFLDTWVAGGLGLGGLGLGVGLGLPQAPQSPCEFVSVGHVWTPISSSACSVCSFLFFLRQSTSFVSNRL